jgi:hypothetical protein
MVASESYVSRPAKVPANFPAQPGTINIALLRPRVQVAQRYLFETELKEILAEAKLPLELLSDAPLSGTITYVQNAIFMQELRKVIGTTKVVAFGREVFDKLSGQIARPPNLPRLKTGISLDDKIFLRVREACSIVTRELGFNVFAKWHGGAECNLFEDTAPHCFGYTSDSPVCDTLTGLLEQAILYYGGVKVTLKEVECMAMGALACRWHCRPV